MFPRNPKVEVFDTGLVILRSMGDGFANEMIGYIKNGDLDPKKICEHLQRSGHRQLRESEKELPGFNSPSPAYSQRLMKEWEQFFEAIAWGDVTRC